METLPGVRKFDCSNQKRISKASGWKTAISVAGESLWNINVRCFVPSYHLMQGEKNVLSILSCPEIRLPKKFSFRITVM